MSVHLATSKEPLRLAFNALPDAKILDMQKRSFFLQRPPKRGPTILWSLDKVINRLLYERFMINPTHENRLHKALFLIALATGLRVSQLAALSRSSSLTRFGRAESSVSLVPHPTCIAKNERNNHILAPIEIPAWFDGEEPHPLCPVLALGNYMRTAPADASDPLWWIWPDSMKSCSRAHVTKIICQVIECSDPGRAPKAYQVRAYAGSVAFLRSFDLELVTEAGQWASCRYS